MRFVYIFLFVFFLFVSKNLFSNNLFESREYEINFDSKNINQIKESKINEIKIKSFQNLIKNILTKQNMKKIKVDDISFINKNCYMSFPKYKTPTLYILKICCCENTRIDLQ